MKQSIYEVIIQNYETSYVSVELFKSLKNARDFMYKDWLGCLDKKTQKYFPKTRKNVTDFELNGCGFKKSSAWTDYVYWEIVRKELN